MRKPDDAKYRERITSNLDVSMLVEAGAGSGKTTSLVGRMLALISTGRCTVDRMAAVTFTRKAAAELKGRFQLALEEAHKTEADPEKRERYQHGLARLELLFAGTIHSFCTRLLRERPIEARIDPDFEELEENEDVILRDQCWHEIAHHGGRKLAAAQNGYGGIVGSDCAYDGNCRTGQSHTSYCGHGFLLYCMRVRGPSWRLRPLAGIMRRAHKKRLG